MDNLDNLFPPKDPLPTVKPSPSADPLPPVSPSPSADPTPPVSPSPSVDPLPSVSPPPSADSSPSVSPSPSEGNQEQENAANTLAPVPGPDPDPKPLPAGVWIAIGAALAAAVIGTALALLYRKKKKQPQVLKLTTVQPSAVSPVSSAGSLVGVGKLHQQGARSSQQDCFGVSPEDLIPTNGLLAVVADGMGGLADGDKVSQTVISTMINSFFLVQGEPDNVLLTLLEQANHQVNSLLGPEGMNRSGSTLVAGLVKAGQFHFLSVGDSRICLYREGVLYQLNREHVFRHELELRAINRKGTIQDAASHPKAAGLTSFLGMGELRYVDMPAQPVSIRPGDKFILMSDGVYNALSEEEFAACLDAPPEEAAQSLDSAIQEKNYSNQDNYTAVILGF